VRLPGEGEEDGAVCWSVRGITVERGRKRWNQPGQQNEGHRGLCAEKIKFSSGWRRLGVKEIGLGFLFPFFVCQNWSLF
jgi:hypothetical protein